MHPLVIGIAGAHSGAGKTTVACEILRQFEGWGAIKYSRTSFFSSITDDPEVIMAQGKDTRRMMDAGAVRVLLVQSPADELPDILPLALGMLSDLQGIVVEGNSAVQLIKPGVVVFVSGDPDLFKDSAEPLLGMADVVLSSSESFPQRPKTRLFRTDDAEGYLSYIKRIIEEKSANR
ncbi:MAG TPA: hypothetical protein VK435_04845 [Thermodesulfovibrionales bacterium]|nr:hypothetical protein [Thermodesulfovibrionales bacterium]